MIQEAIKLAVKAHDGQLRKGTEIPYIVHPLSVGIILAKAGCTDEIIAAGILHDTVEDTPVTLKEIRLSFGEKVADIVRGASEPDKSLPWEERKEHTIETLESLSLGALLVICADKLDNINSIVSEYLNIGEKVWERFRRGKEAQAWYYSSMVGGLAKRLNGTEYQFLVEELKNGVKILFGTGSGKEN